MREWKFENGVLVVEESLDYDLHCFKVYNGDIYLGTVYPDSIETMNSMIIDLENGQDPISERWEDGNGNTCTLEGWGNLR